MASYTMTLREYIEQASQEHKLSVKEQIKIGRLKLFDFDYPFFDEAYKNVFETNFIRNFYMREIGFETEGLFKFQLETWLLINMPYYNKLFESELLKYNPLTNSDFKNKYLKIIDKTQNENRDKTQTDERNRLQNDNRDITKNDITSNHETGSINSNSNQDSTQISNINGDSTDNSTSKNTRDQTKLINGADAINNFKRDINNDTPDSRLAITTKDGQGVIEYANNINEETQNNKKSWDNRTRDEETNDNFSNSVSTTNQDSNTSVNTNVSDDVTNLNESNGTLNSSIDDTLESNINDKLSSIYNDKLVSSINDIEDYVQHTTGKQGIVSYPKLVQEYRESFLRIEKQIFYEMNELFMLVY